MGLAMRTDHFTSLRGSKYEDTEGEEGQGVPT